MSISSGRKSIELKDITSKVSEFDILFYYLGVSDIPCVIQSPLRKDNKPSFGLYTHDGERVFYTDFSTGDKGGLFDLLSSMWSKSYIETLETIYNDLPKFKTKVSAAKNNSKGIKIVKLQQSNTDLQCKIRDWKQYDIDFWKSYGISVEWLKFAEVYPIEYKIIIKDNHRYIFRADKYAYAYVEHKEGKTTLKIYQPFNKKGYKWSNKHDMSVISLWTKIPEFGEAVCICSSLKDALCLWANTGIPSLAIQGEGYKISDTAKNELRRRYKNIFICLDNDKPGLKDAESLAENTGFINIVLPYFEGGKDISDLYKIKGKKQFVEIMKNLFTQNSTYDDLPF